MATSIASLVLVASVFGGSAASAVDPDKGPTAGGTVVSLPQPVASFDSVSSGAGHDIARDSEGNVWAWGRNEHGQLGTGDTTQRNRPVPVTAPVRFASVDAGEQTSYGIDTDGHLWSWGSNEEGQLGTGDTGDRNTPTMISSPVRWTAVSGGTRFAIALDVDGNIWAWGDNQNGQLGNGVRGAAVLTPTKITTSGGFTQLDAGLFHSLALDGSGRIWSWGYGQYGDLGLGTEFQTVLQPTRLAAPGPFTSVRAGNYHSLALSAAGDVWGFGVNGSAELGLGSMTPEWVPLPIQITSGRTFTGVQTGSLTSFALDEDGNLWSWGNGSYYGQLANGDQDPRYVPTQATTRGGFTSIASGGWVGGAATHKDHQLYTWGPNWSGEAGTGRGPGEVEYRPVNIIQVEVTSVAFDGIDGTGLTNLADGTSSVTTPAHAAGPVDVTLRWRLNGVEQTPIVYPGGFTYIAPAVAPTITDPADRTVADGTGASFTVSTTGIPTPTVTWELSRDKGATWEAITGDPSSAVSSDGLTVTVTGSATNNGYLYRATAANSAGSALSAPAHLTVILPTVPPKPTEETSTTPTGQTPTGQTPTTPAGQTPTVSADLAITGGEPPVILAGIAALALLLGAGVLVARSILSRRPQG